MRRLTIPIRALAPEGQLEDAGEKGLDFLPMPREMSTFEMPALPQATPADLAAAAGLLQGFVAEFGQWLAAPPGTRQEPRLELRGQPPALLRAVNESLGQGEVSAIAAGPPPLHVQETVFTGVWRLQVPAAAGGLLGDALVAAALPQELLQAAQQDGLRQLPPRPVPQGAMNVQPLLAELQAAMDACEPGRPAHVINLSLLPLSPEDSAHLQAVLGEGRVTVLSRGFGNCRIGATAARGVWRVQYFNNMNTLILDTVEVVTMPEAALAAPEDLAESRSRLAELVQWMAEAAQQPDSAAP